jgi:polar amino acid transport system substrate-binding protein
MRKTFGLLLAVLGLFLIQSCTERKSVGSLQELGESEFAVPSGTVADQLVLSRFPQARFQYFNNVLDACLAVKSGKVTAAAYDEPTLRNIAAKIPGLKVLPDMITVDQYGYAVALGDTTLKAAIDQVLAELRSNGGYEEMRMRWLPERGAPAPMPSFSFEGTNGVLRFGTASVTEPFSFIDASQKVVGMDIEIASRVAQKLGKSLEVVDMDFGAMIPALISGKVDMIGACITITEERAKNVLFSEPYYSGGIAAIVRE